MGVALRSAETGVAQELLDGAKIHAAGQQVRREAVAKGMGTDARPERGPFHGLLKQIPDTGGGQAPAGSKNRRGGRRDFSAKWLLLNCR